MADLRLQDRLQPALLDRLREGGAGERSAISLQELRAAVMRDLEWLLNATCLDCVQPLDRYPHAASSVINYGMPDLTGCIGIDRVGFAKRLRQVLIDFEPRLSRKSIKVRPVELGDDAPGNHLEFHIEAELWAEPVPIHLMLKTEISLDSGDAQVIEGGGDD